MEDKKNIKKTPVKITVRRTRRTASPIRTAIYTYTLALVVHNGWGKEGKQVRPGVSRPAWLQCRIGIRHVREAAVGSL